MLALRLTVSCAHGCIPSPLRGEACASKPGDA